MAADREGIPEVKCKMDRIARARGEMNMKIREIVTNLAHKIQNAALTAIEKVFRL